MVCMEDEHGPAAGSPEALLARFREGGHPRDMAALFDATSADLFRLALHLVPDAATAEDVLQETFLAVLDGSAAYEPGRPAMPWLTGVLRNQAGMARLGVGQVLEVLGGEGVQQRHAEQHGGNDLEGGG